MVTFRDTLFYFASTTFLYGIFKLARYGDTQLQDYWFERDKRLVIGKVLTVNKKLYDTDAVISLTELRNIFKRNVIISLDGNIISNIRLEIE